MTSEATLADFVADLSTEDIPDPVVERAGLTIADTIGAIIAGSRDPAVRSFAGRCEETTAGNATVLGRGTVSTTPMLAAFCNGAAGTVLELDEGHRFAAGHPAIHVLPALLADAEVEYSNGDDFLRAFVAGYEVAARVARATLPLAEGYHPHGVWGAVGGAAAVASHRGLAAEQIRTAMAIAANYAQHTRFEAATEGATVRNSYAGMSNLASLVAVEQTVSGFTGLSSGISRHLSLAAGEDFDEDSLQAGLGDRWELHHGYFKIHAACRYTHPTLDAIERVRESVDPDAIESITVETYPAAARLTESQPRNALQAKFSIPFAVATALLTGETGPESFDDEAITPETRALSERVTVTTGSEFAERAPEKRGARVSIDLGDSEIVETVEAPRGGDHDPFTEAELREKFQVITRPVIGADRATALWESARSLEPPRVLSTLAQG